MVAGSEAGALGWRVLGAWGKSPSQDKVLPLEGCSGGMGLGMGGNWDSAPEKQRSSMCLQRVKDNPKHLWGLDL